MATNVTMDKQIVLCKKCGIDHERLVGSKCEKVKTSKEEKRDTSKEAVRKTPRGKGGDVSSQEKMVELMMSTMTNFTDKLNTMDERISGLTSRLDNPSVSQKPVSRKSRSCEKIKRIKISDDDEKAPCTSSLTTVAEDGTIYSTMIPDVAVTLKPTPARPKKLKADPELGVAPLAKPTSSQVTGIKSLPRVTSTISRPQATSSVTWDAPVQVNFSQTTVAEKPLPCDVNFNLPTYSDQYGDPVQVHSLTDMGGTTITEYAASCERGTHYNGTNCVHTCS